MRLLHRLAKTRASFDDPNLVSQADLVPVMALAERAGLADLVTAHVRPDGDCGANAVPLEIRIRLVPAGLPRVRRRVRIR